MHVDVEAEFIRFYAQFIAWFRECEGTFDCSTDVN